MPELPLSVLLRQRVGLMQLCLQAQLQMVGVQQRCWVSLVNQLEWHVSLRWTSAAGHHLISDVSICCEVLYYLQHQYSES